MLNYCYVNVTLIKEEMSWISDLIFDLKKWKKKEQSKPKANRRKEKITTKTEINKIEKENNTENQLN